MDAPTPFVRFRSLLRRRAPTVLCAVAGILLMLALILGAVYLSFQSMALRSISLRDDEFSAQTDALANLMEDMIRNYGMQAFYAPEISELRENADISDMERVRDLRELGTYVSSSDFVDSITVYNRVRNTIYSTDADVLSDTADRFVDRSAVEMFLNLNADMRMTPLRRIAFPERPDKQREYFSFLFFETDSEDTPLGSAMMLNVAYDWFVGNLLSFDDRDSCVLLDRQGRLVYAPDPLLAREAAFFQMESDDDTGYLLRRYEHKQLVCHFSRIDSTGWYCLRILPLEECLPGLLQLRNTLAACLTLAVALLAASCTATLIFLYAPFHKIRLALQRVSEDSGPPEVQIRSLVRDSLQYQQSHLLIDLLEGRPVPPERIPAEPLTLLLITAANPAPVRAFLSRDCPAALLRHERGREVTLIPALSEDEIQALCTALTEHTDCRCYCGVPRGANELPASYATLRELHQLRFWYPGQLIICEKHFAPRAPHSSLSEKQLTALLSALRGGEAEEGRAIWRQILESIRCDSYRDQRFAFNRVAQLLQETLNEQSQPAERILPDEFLAELEDIGALTARFDLFFALICRHSIDQRRRRLGDIAAQVARRIDAGYADPELSLPRIADEMGMSGAYLGRLFRESLGLSIGDYMNRVRVENGARLLLSTDLTVEAVAGAVGFGNQKYFYVVFKNTTGQTPLQFRKQNLPLPPIPTKTAAE
ncbi:MAG: helix-turn-helix domain-containing protein [Oscillospiraceae bacterium]